MSDDVVAELDRWCSTAGTAANAYEFMPLNELLARARDEIVALRERLREQNAAITVTLENAHAATRIARREGAEAAVVKLKAEAVSEARAEALEEAARACEGGYTTGSTASTLRAVAKAIRALKDRRA